MSEQALQIHSGIWQEEAEADNPFAARACYCHGYDVYGDLLSKASWIDYLYLLFRGERPSAAQAQLLQRLAIALANPGPRAASVRAAMNGGVGGSTAASSLMAALAVGAGQYGGAHEVFRAMRLWQECGLDLARWQQGLRELLADRSVDIWLPMEHAPGFDPNGESCPTPVRQTLTALAESGADGPGALTWLQANREALEALALDVYNERQPANAGIAACPLSLTGVAAAALFELGFQAEQAEMLYLMLTLPGAAAHALEQEDMGWRKFPFVGHRISLTDDPGPRDLPGVEEFGL